MLTDFLGRAPESEWDPANNAQAALTVLERAAFDLPDHEELELSDEEATAVCWALERWLAEGYEFPNPLHDLRDVVCEEA
jgi:hypothetical protein